MFAIKTKMGNSQGVSSFHSRVAAYCTSFMTQTSRWTFSYPVKHQTSENIHQRYRVNHPNLLSSHKYQIPINSSTELTNNHVNRQYRVIYCTTNKHSAPTESGALILDFSCCYRCAFLSKNGSAAVFSVSTWMKFSSKFSYKLGAWGTNTCSAVIYLIVQTIDDSSTKTPLFGKWSCINSPVIHRPAVSLQVEVEVKKTFPAALAWKTFRFHHHHRPRTTPSRAVPAHLHTPRVFFVQFSSQLNSLAKRTKTIRVKRFFFLRSEKFLQV